MDSEGERVCIGIIVLTIYHLLVTRFNWGEGKPLSAIYSWRCTADMISTEGAVMDGRGPENKVSCHVFSMTLHSVTACGHVDSVAGKSTHK